ncbi:hypothetical protein HNQ91_002612 [Filimonas zeae]|uniref:Beta-galactosidase n=1 Tax=Filimonas zeae TaxID=1737353 RepID=A0A917ISL8_9BACT|nr:beta-galactosidase [Filimonas zeae]MDR6339561.1 hypothetical protein [Filimonas zeae]GGH63043.1 hypothetical protein GCM10011379_13500 [Filimonas zeae]
MKKQVFSLASFCCLALAVYAQQPLSGQHVTITPRALPATVPAFQMGTAANPHGETLTFNTQSMLLNGRPVLPVMGELHFSRVPEKEWEKELLKMKAGGVTIVSTYVFWIHHEETEKQYNWSGQRNLRKFIETCKKVNLPLVLRIGPWCHGEVRNGGIPEWLATSGIKLRNDNAAYLDKVHPWWQQIFQQARGMMWGDGGPVIGIQLENEYRGKWEHLMTLKNMARTIGFNTPLYTRTGWPALTSPATFGEIVPLYGDYPDGFWDRSLAEMPGDYSKVYLFRSFRNSTVIATEQLPKQSDKDNPEDFAYPYFTCELGGGMMPSYHRRIQINPMDIYAMALVKVGSGSNMPGYYMYHGGTNPQGQHTTLQETQASPMTNHNELPVKSYDFQAPLGEFGQIHPQYHLLRRMHLFLQDFGGDLALMHPYFPDSVTNARDSASLRWSVRSNGNSGYVFVNNYQRLQNSPAKENIQFHIQLPGEEVRFPEKPVTIPANSSFFMPFNLKLGAITLKYATAQPIAKLKQGDTLTYFFAATSGLPADFAFDSVTKVEYPQAAVKNQPGGVRFSNTPSGTRTAIRLRGADGVYVDIVLLDEPTSLALWKGNLAGKEYILLSPAGVTCNGNELELTGTGNTLPVSLFPAPALQYGAKVLAGKHSGIFTQFTIPLPALTPVKVSLTRVAGAGPLRTIKNGVMKVAEAPSDKDFDHAAVWKITLPRNMDKNRDVYLQLPYMGDVARVYAGNTLLTDNFYNGKPFELGLKRFAEDIQNRELTVKILPLQKGAPVYFQHNSTPAFNGADTLLALPDVHVLENRSVILKVAPGTTQVQK